MINETMCGSFWPILEDIIAQIRGIVQELDNGRSAFQHAGLNQGADHCLAVPFEARSRMFPEARALEA